MYLSKSWKSNWNQIEEKNEKFEETVNLMTDSALARKEKEQNDQQWVRKHLSEI